MCPTINAIVEIDIKTATREDLDFIEKAKNSLMSYDPIEYKNMLWLISSIEYDLKVYEHICKIVMVGAKG